MVFRPLKRDAIKNVVSSKSLQEEVDYDTHMTGSDRKTGNEGPKKVL